MKQPRLMLLGEGRSVLLRWQRATGTHRTTPTQLGRFDSLRTKDVDRAVRLALLIAPRNGSGNKKPAGGCRFVPWLQQGKWTAPVGNLLQSQISIWIGHEIWR